MCFVHVGFIDGSIKPWITCECQGFNSGRLQQWVLCGKSSVLTHCFIFHETQRQLLRVQETRSTGWVHTRLKSHKAILPQSVARVIAKFLKISLRDSAGKCRCKINVHASCTYRVRVRDRVSDLSQSRDTSQQRHTHWCTKYDFYCSLMLFDSLLGQILTAAEAWVRFPLRVRECVCQHAWNQLNDERR